MGAAECVAKKVHILISTSYLIVEKIDVTLRYADNRSRIEGLNTTLSSDLH